MAARKLEFRVLQGVQHLERKHPRRAPHAADIFSYLHAREPWHWAGRRHLARGHMLVRAPLNSLVSKRWLSEARGEDGRPSYSVMVRLRRLCACWALHSPPLALCALASRALTR
jgi:hypothetical protein